MRIIDFCRLNKEFSLNFPEDYPEWQASNDVHWDNKEFSLNSLNDIYWPGHSKDLRKQVFQ